MARSKAQMNAELCGSTNTCTGNPCRWPYPCPYHNADGSKKRFNRKRVKQNGTVIRHEKFIQAQLAGKSTVQAGREAGYAESTLKGKIFQIADSPAIKERIQAHIERAALQTNEILGTVVSLMRTDLADHIPNDELLQRSKELGISHQIKKYKRAPVLVGFDKHGKSIIEYKIEVEAYSVLDAAKVLTKVFGLEQLPAPNQKAMVAFNAAVDRVVQQAEEIGIKDKQGNPLTGERLRKAVEEKLKPAFPKLTTNVLQ